MHVHACAHIVISVETLEDGTESWSVLRCVHVANATEGLCRATWTNETIFSIAQRGSGHSPILSLGDRSMIVITTVVLLGTDKK